MNVKQAANVLDLLEYFAKHRRPASLAEIAKHFEWPRSSTFNLLGTLAARGFLYEPKARGGYYPTPLWSALVQQIDSADPVPHQLHLVLQALMESTGETAVLAAASGAQAVFVDSVESPHAIRYTSESFRRFRGMEAVDLSSVAGVVARVSELAAELANEIEEIDVDPRRALSQPFPQLPQLLQLPQLPQFPQLDGIFFSARQTSRQRESLDRCQRSTFFDQA